MNDIISCISRDLNGGIFILTVFVIFFFAFKMGQWSVRWSERNKHREKAAR